MTDGIYHPPGVNDEVKASIKRTWSIFISKGKIEDLGRPMFMKLFEQSPDTKRLFHYNEKEEEAGKRKLDNHIKKLFGQIKEAVEHVDDLTMMTFHIIGLGRVHHSTFHVHEKYYTDFGDCLIYALKTALGDEMGEEDMKAWKLFYAWLGGCIVKGINDEKMESQGKR